MSGFYDYDPNPLPAKPQRPGLMVGIIQNINLLVIPFLLGVAVGHSFIRVPEHYYAIINDVRIRRTLVFNFPFRRYELLSDDRMNKPETELGACKTELQTRTKDFNMCANSLSIMVVREKESEKPAGDKK